MAQLDRSRDFAVIFGESRGRYAQDGKEFDASGDEINAQASVTVVVEESIAVATSTAARLVSAGKALIEKVKGSF